MTLFHGSNTIVQKPKVLTSDRILHRTGSFVPKL